MMLRWKLKSHSNEYGEGNYQMDKNDGSCFARNNQPMPTSPHGHGKLDK